MSPPPRHLRRLANATQRYTPRPGRGAPPTTVRILVVEDNPRMVSAIRYGLVQQGFSVDICESGAEGEELAAVEGYDVLVLDRMLPDRDGVEVCRNLRRRGIHTPVLLLTALSSIPDKVVGLDAGADDYLVKPFDFEELLARIRSLLRRGRASESARLSHGPVEIDLHRRKVRRDGEEIELSAKEFALLEFFVRHPDRVHDRMTIAQKVWDMHYEPASNVIEVYVSSLRKKLDRGRGRPLIHTVVGAGYLFGDAGGGEGGERPGSSGAP